MARASTRPPGESTRTRQPADRNQILASALQLFYERGYHATSMQDIADSVGVLKGSLYYHIENKEELLLTLLSLSIDDVYDAIATAAATEGTPSARLRRLILGELTAVAAHQKEIAIWQTERRRARGLLQEIDAKARLADEVVRSVLLECAQEHGLSDEEFDLAYHAVQGLIVSFSSWYKPGGPVALESIASRYADYAEAILAA